MKEVINKIKSSKNSLVLTHVNPDGDAIGSSLALVEFLNLTGSKSKLFLSNELDDKYLSYSPNINKENIICDLSLINVELIDTIFILDSGCYDRVDLGDNFKFEDLPKEKIVNVDHHQGNGMFGSVNYIDISACATGEIVFDMLSKLDESSINPTVATLLLVAILTDTGGLRFDNTKDYTLNNVAKLMSLCADYTGIIKKLYFNKKYNLCALESDILLNNLNWAFDKKFAYTYLSEELLKKHNISMDESESLIDTIKAIEGVEFAALLTKKDDFFKVSLRSVNEKYSILSMAQVLEGGGHLLAAGCKIRESNLEDAYIKLLETVKEEVL